MRDIVVPDTSSLFYLYQAGCLELLKKLYGEITVPYAVAVELEEGRKQGENVLVPDDYSWIKIKSIKVPPQIELIPDLGKGEAEVLAFGLEIKKHRLIIDDKLARTIAKLHRLTFTGTAGVLLKSKTEGHLKEIKTTLEALQKAGFFLKEELCENILRLAGEL